MNDVLTMEEIEARYTGEWVLLENPEIDTLQNVLRGRLLWHSPDRDEIDRKDVELCPRDAAVLFIGDPPDDLAFIL
jgi:hypothetical protein